MIQVMVQMSSKLPEQYQNSPVDDLTRRARIRGAALELIAEHGVEGISVRTVAKRAGVSPNLVIHHFGSKEGLREAVDEAASARIDGVFEALAETDLAPPRVLEVCAEQTLRLAREEPQLVDYFARALAEGTNSAVVLFDQLLALARSNLDGMREAGALRADADVDMLALQAVTRWLAPVLLRPFLERHLPDSLLSEPQLRRWLDAQSDLLLNGLYAGGVSGAHDEPDGSAPALSS